MGLLLTLTFEFLLDHQRRLWAVAENSTNA